MYKKAVIVLVVLGLLSYLSLTYLEWSPPSIQWVNQTPYLGLRNSLNIRIIDRGRGIKRIEVIYSNGKKTPIFSANYSKEKLPTLLNIEVPFEPLKSGIRGTGGKLIITAEDGSYLWMGKGNLKRAEYRVTIDPTPPSIEVLSTDHVVLQGGTEAVVFRTSEDVKEAWIEVGDHRFKAYRNPFRDEPAYIALFSYPYNLKRGRPVFIVAKDRAGNESKKGLSILVKPKLYRSRRIKVGDGFLERKLPEIISASGLESSGDLLKDFILVNHDLRKRNEERIREIASGSSPEPLWKGAFIYLRNAKVEANFADFRSYYYKGKKVDEAYHLGYDLASVKKAPVPASNRGRVVFAGYNGIYGNTVIIDHGLGLFSLYSHLSSIDVKEGDMVEKGDTLGRTGETGLAGGDHLHFGILVEGVYVNPVEWWDPRWVKNRIQRRLQLLKGD